MSRIPTIYSNVDRAHEDAKQVHGLKEGDYVVEKSPSGYSIRVIRDLNKRPRRAK